jgi:hypothetical protein
VSVVSDYRLEDRGSILAKAKYVFLASVQTSSEAHPACNPVATGGKGRPVRDTDNSASSSAEVKNE